jgi:hypothetical protein
MKNISKEKFKINIQLYNKCQNIWDFLDLKNLVMELLYYI